MAGFVAGLRPAQVLVDMRGRSAEDWSEPPRQG
jgi:hypothetical protein